MPSNLHPERVTVKVRMRGSQPSMLVRTFSLFTSGVWLYQHMFQSQTRSQSPGDVARLCNFLSIYMFQSQTRSQSPGDITMTSTEISPFGVSIADAKPIPWRRGISGPIQHHLAIFNRRR